MGDISPSSQNRSLPKTFLGSSEWLNPASERKLARFGLAALSFLFLSFSGGAHAWISERAGNDSLLFKPSPSGTPAIQYRAPFPEPEWIAFLGEDTDSPFVLLQGRTCANCSSQQKSLYLVNVKPNSRLYSLVPPGRITDPKKGLVFESRAFYGRCLKDNQEGYYSFQREHVNKRRGFQKSVFSAVVSGANGGTELTETLLDGGRRLPRVETALSAVKRKVCFELPRVNRTVMRNAFDLGPNRVGLKEKEEEEDPEKEFERNEKKSPDALEEEAARTPSSAAATAPETETPAAIRAR